MTLAGFSCSRAADRGKAKEHLNFTLVSKRHKSISDFISRGIPDPSSVTSTKNYCGVVEVSGPANNYCLAARSHAWQKGETRELPVHHDHAACKKEYCILLPYGVFALLGNEFGEKLCYRCPCVSIG